MFGPSLHDNVLYRQKIRRKHAFTGFRCQSRLHLMASWSDSEERKLSVLKLTCVYLDVNFDLILMLDNSEISQYTELFEFLK